MTVGYTVITLRPNRNDPSVQDVGIAGNVWPDIEPCENHLAYCEATAEAEPERYGNVKYAIAQLSVVETNV